MYQAMESNSESKGEMDPQPLTGKHGRDGQLRGGGVSPGVRHAAIPKLRTWRTCYEYTLQNA